MYKNIIFDIGNVLLNFKPEEYLMKKFNNTETVMTLSKEIYQSQEWVMLDKGTITEKDAINILTQRHPNNKELIIKAFTSWYDILTPIEETVEILKKLKRLEYRLYFLSNFHHLAFEHVTKKFDFFNIFDGGIVSYKVKLVKPDINIYNMLVSKYDLNPEESVFIDDMNTNIESANKCNLGTILFKSPEDLIESLKTYNIIFPI